MPKTGKKELTPKLRFPEFREEPGWEEESLGKQFANRQEKGFTDLPLLSVTDERGVIPQGETNRKDNSNSDKSKYLRVVPGDIAYNTMRMWEGRSAYVNMEGLVSPAYTVCQPQKGKHGKFFSYYFKTPTLIEQFRRYSQGLVKDTLNLKYDGFACISVSVPNPAEQQKIADCLASLDDLITAEGRKLTALRDHKRGLMQQLFPQPGQTQPRLRFPAFRGKGKWETYPLSHFISALDAGVSVNAGDRPAIGSEFGVLKTSCVTNGTFEFSENKVVLKPDELVRAKESVQGNTIIISRMNTRELVGANAYVEIDLPNIFLPDRLWAAKSSGNGNMRFIAYYLGSGTGRAALSGLAAGTSGSMKNISKNGVFKMELAAPELPEQQAIADCLAALDTQFSAQTAKIESLKTHKRGLMQQLFPASEDN